VITNGVTGTYLRKSKCHTFLRQSLKESMKITNNVTAARRAAKRQMGSLRNETQILITTLGHTIIQAVTDFSQQWPGFAPKSVQWNLWWTKCHWDRFFSKFFGSPLSRSFHCCSAFIHLSSGRLTMGTLVATVPCRQSHPKTIIRIIVTI
jgi:hypothetical protein